MWTCNNSQPATYNIPAPQIDYDSHVHIMSPYLISRWKDAGIPFSRSEASYSNIDTILHKNGARFIDLIGMGYVFENREYYRAADAWARLKAENNWLAEAAKKYSARVRPFFAIDPLQDYALEELERCFAINPECGIKLHFYTSNVNLKLRDHRQKVGALLLRAAINGIPVLLHFDNGSAAFGRGDVEILADSLLPEMPALSLTIAHWGTSGGFTKKTKAVIDAFAGALEKEHVRKHNIRFDISGVGLNKDAEGADALSDNEFRELKRYMAKIGVHRIVFGSDYPLYNAGEYGAVLLARAGFSSETLKLISRLPKDDVRITEKQPTLGDSNGN